MFQAASVFGGNGASTVLWRWLYRVDSGAYDDGLATTVHKLLRLRRWIHGRANKQCFKQSSALEGGLQVKKKYGWEPRGAIAQRRRRHWWVDMSRYVKRRRLISITRERTTSPMHFIQILSRDRLLPTFFRSETRSTWAKNSLPALAHSVRYPWSSRRGRVVR